MQGYCSLMVEGLRDFREHSCRRHDLRRRQAVGDIQQAHPARSTPSDTSQVDPGRLLRDRRYSELRQCEGHDFDPLGRYRCGRISSLGIGAARVKSWVSEGAELPPSSTGWRLRWGGSCDYRRLGPLGRAVAER